MASLSGKPVLAELDNCTIFESVFAEVWQALSQGPEDFWGIPHPASATANIADTSFAAVFTGSAARWAYRAVVCTWV